VVVLSFRRWKGLKRGWQAPLAVLDIKKGYRNGVNVPCNVEHLRGIFDARLEVGRD
jgi:hypothetical protein